MSACTRLDAVDGVGGVDGELRRVLGAGANEDAVSAARRLVEELISWRDGYAAAFGGATTTPHAALLKIAKTHADDLRISRGREEIAWSTLRDVTSLVGRMTIGDAATWSLREARQLAEQMIEALSSEVDRG